VLVVTQSQRVHRQIVDLLSQLARQHAATASGMFGGNDVMGIGVPGGAEFADDLDAGLGQPFPASGGAERDN
jgi:hypothetical protein